ncbi:MAG: hypothetical protein DWQ34_07450 [Planctomycetota bacterium]|nr:MAG: hypothetical protein DWQ29_13230 [Planctomycetota bacterium]REJ94895.1 MAG: hypothetical protein DWQ34_07450 [Planctomycetota bacterium]REK27283.1 MAG: hypothetical protein DWQ41_07910 [Planctomycetota bacterium]REK36696.1 MAG: hypothetical protein DWQ45_08725 [Planctomycetota bacterium]
MPRRFLTIALSLTTLLAHTAFAEVDNQQGVLQSVFPAGGQRGTTVEVTFTGNHGGLEGADGLLIDGPPGIIVEKFESLSAEQARATLTIAPDASPGRRMIRVKGGTTGLTNFRWFFVGSLAEHIESTKNNELAAADTVETPVVVNGRVEATLDQDCFRFEARQGQNLVVAVQSHLLDAMGFDRNTAGFGDASLELLDDSGAVVAEDGDTLGYDPLIEFTVPQDGSYTVRVSGMGYKGFPQFVYRLTIGEVPYPTALFPPGGTRGSSLEVTFTGPNVPPGTTRQIDVAADASPVQYISLDGAAPDLPFLPSDVDELTPEDPPSEQGDALAIGSRPVIVNGRFEKVGDADWFRLDLDQGEKIALDIVAQRHLRSPVDTLLELFDADGKLLAANDDNQLLLSEVVHEFVPFDSGLSYEAKQAGPHFIRVSEQSGSSGPRTAYRLELAADEPDFKLYQWPDAVPVWGPGTTAGFVVEIHRFGGLDADVALSIEGLPEGWIGGTATAFAADYKHAFRGAFGHKVFLTISAPAAAPVGTIAEFHVVGRAVADDQEDSRTAQPLSHLSWGEPNRFRVGVKSRTVVAPPQGLPLEPMVTEITAAPVSTVEIPLAIPDGQTPEKPLSLSVNRAGTHFKCSIGAPVNVTFRNGKGVLTLPLPDAFTAGRTYELLIANAWTSETRKGLPGPCTPLIRLNIAEQ